jgi:hypothetical protein
MRLIIATVALVALAGCMSAEQKEYKHGVEVCWQVQARKSNTPQEARSFAAECEFRDAEYEKKFGVKP